MRFETISSGISIYPESTEGRQKVGCWVKVRYAFYPETTDTGFENYKKSHYVHVPIDWDKYKQWVDSLPKDKDDNPIYPNLNDPYDGYPGTKHWTYNAYINHFHLFEPEVTDETINAMGIRLAKKYALQLKDGIEIPYLPSQTMAVKVATRQRVDACLSKVNYLKANIVEGVARE